MRPWGQLPKFHWWLHLTTWTEWNLILKFHNLIINSTIINKSTIINSWEWYLQLLARRRSMLRSHYIQTNGILRLQLWNWLELFTLKWCTREDGLLGRCKAKIWMGNPRLDSLLWDGRWMNWFVLRLRKEDSWWLLSRAVRLKAPKGGFVLIVAENDRVLWISAWCVEMEDLDFHSIELLLPFYVL